MNKIHINKIRINRIHWDFLITLIGLGSLVFAIGKSRAIDFEQYQQYRNTINQLQQKESDFIQIILSSRYELYVSYDPLVNNLNSQKEIQKQLANIPNFLNAKEKKEIQSLLKERETLLSQKESLSEWFKSQNSLLKNSLRYLPLLASQLEKKVANAEEKTSILNRNSLTSLRIIFNDLLRNILLYNITNNEDLTPAIEQQIERLSQLKEQNKIGDREFPLQLVISHANIILTQKPQVEELTAQLLISSPQQTKDLANLYRTSYQKASRIIGVYRVLRSGLFVTLLVWFNYLFLRRLDGNRNKNSDFQQVNVIEKNNQDIKSPELSDKENVLKTSIKSDSLEAATNSENLEVLAEAGIEKKSEQDNEELKKEDEIEEESEVTKLKEINKEKREHPSVLDTNILTNKVVNEKDGFWEDVQSIELCETEEETLETGAILEEDTLTDEEVNKTDEFWLESKPISLLELEENNSSEIQEILPIRESTHLVETDNRGSIATLPVYPLNSKNLHLWLQEINKQTFSLAIAVRKYIKKKPCKIWLDRLKRLSSDRVAKLKKQKDKNKIE